MLFLKDAGINTGVCASGCALAVPVQKRAHTYSILHELARK
jgi:hypothetical protein